MPAPLAALLFLGAAFLTTLLGITAAVCGLRHRGPGARRALAALGLVLAGYAALLAGFSLASRERTIALGGEKYFCSLDCHMAYSVRGVTWDPAIVSVPSRGRYLAVTVRAWFDPSTIAPRRGTARPLWPDSLTIIVVDERGREYRPSPQAQAAWDRAGGHVTPLTRPVHPGEENVRDVVFDLPRELRDPRLLIIATSFPTPILIGDENSLLHRKTYMLLR